MLEGDVSTGPLVNCFGNEKDAPETSVRVAGGGPVIMAHYPTERKSDLALEHFVFCVLEHNANSECAACEGEGDEARRLADGAAGGDAAEGERASRASPSSSPAASASPRGAASAGAMERQPSEDVSTDDEATAFVKELNRELDEAAADNQIIPVCVGSRKLVGKSLASSRPAGARKGIKLDFKQFSCVEPTLQFLRKVDAAKRLNGHLWLNADVFAGPGSLVTPLDAQKFVRHCAEYLPEAVLSLGWGATVLSTYRQYTHEMIDRMIELCMCPIVKHSLPCSSPSQGGEHGGREPDPTESMYVVAPAMACRHITFAVAAEYALASAANLKRLLELMPSASLTIYTGVGSLGVTPSTVQEFLRAFGKRRCFLDLRVSRPWKSWIFGSGGGANLAAAAPLRRQGAAPAPQLPLEEGKAAAVSSYGPPQSSPGRASPTDARGGPPDVIAII